MSGLTFYLYNEVSTLALKSISGVTHSVANTAKRAIIIVGCAIAFGESMVRLPRPASSLFVSLLATSTFFAPPSAFNDPVPPFARQPLTLNLTLNLT